MGSLATLWAYLREIISNQRGIMATVQELTQRMNAATAAANDLKTTLLARADKVDADVANLKAQIEALRPLVTDPAAMAAADAALAELEASVSALSSVELKLEQIDEQTPDLPEPPSPPQG